MKTICGTMFVREQASKGIEYRFIKLNDNEFSLIINASNYPQEYWTDYYNAVESFVNSLSSVTKEQFWLTYKEINTSCVNWQNVIDEDTNVIVTKFDQQLIIGFIDDFHLKLLTD